MFHLGKLLRIGISILCMTGMIPLHKQGFLNSRFGATGEGSSLSCTELRCRYGEAFQDETSYLRFRPCLYKQGFLNSRFGATGNETLCKRKTQPWKYKGRAGMRCRYGEAFQDETSYLRFRPCLYYPSSTPQIARDSSIMSNS
jgi:hypothetical protein